MEYNIYILWTEDNPLTENRINSINQLKVISECNIILINNENLSKYILSEYPLHPAYNYLSAVHKSDYLRTYLMHFHGGGYSDIKNTKGSWKKSFENLYNSNKWIIGYPEIRNGNARTVPQESYNKLIGNGCYICKKRTPLTNEWYNNLIYILNNKLSELKIYPAKNLRDCNTKHNKYPIKWTEILGDIYHPLILKYNDKVLRTLPMCICNNYK
tara:strand:+ start:8797 stop:9438 length:642 start_codon:yes stop_codon:yes gene_type:complete